MLVTTPPHTFRTKGWARTVASWFGDSFMHRKTGAHGYAPDHPDMAGVLLAMGRGVAPGTKLPPQHMIDVAPTVAALLGIDPPQHAEGAPIAGLVLPD